MPPGTPTKDDSCICYAPEYCSCKGEGAAKLRAEIAEFEVE